MTTSSRFRIYYVWGSDVLSEELEAATLAEAVAHAESRRTAARGIGYFEIWQDANLLSTSADILHAA